MNTSYESAAEPRSDSSGPWDQAGHIDPAYAAPSAFLGTEGRDTRPPAPRAGWRQASRDAIYLLPGLPIAIASFVLMMTGFWLGLGLVVLAFLGFVVLLITLMTARGFAAAERGRVGIMEGRRVGPAYYRNPSGAGLSRIAGYLRDPQLWRDFGHGLIILPVRVFTWSVAVTWIAGALMVTYVIWAWSLPRDDDEYQGLADLLFGWDSLTADVAVNTAISIFFIATLPYVLRGLAAIESAIAWAMLTNEGAAWRARAEELGRSREAVVQAEADTLRRVERDIHDGPQQRLVRLTMDLQSAQRRLHDDPDAAGPLVDGALAQTQEALSELRALSRGIAPPILTDRGLGAALAAAAARNPIPTTVDVQLGVNGRLPASVENAAYFVVTESLANAAKHSDATRCEISVVAGPGVDPEGRTVDVVYIQVGDNGRGGAHIGKGHGLAGLADRLAGVDGELEIASPPGGGTTVVATIPVPSAPTS